MSQDKVVNPDLIIQQAFQAKLNVYQAIEHFETVLKAYNDQVDNLINVVGLMKNRILELEADKRGTDAGVTEANKKEFVHAK